ncbi:hypothetical protein N7491_006536 [Penicillium cf. griseofulvum]|uniref:Uncharacterized protein n=1 Tax=Penicillium cf. griseofulvum TaxID=2972120 RepID=A0A9W9J126_9EURO|nr:hypothetical protein N7472_010436 [Penicillium cf. griseofulvum]KAJ5429520.1 hypothetical protein N7491_006536 [Penicillium cf. griseofulvum]KAJ5436701.1 hypothetical protein N7445_007586 [Penicillium cf. griseofulvum]
MAAQLLWKSVNIEKARLEKGSRPYWQICWIADGNVFLDELAATSKKDWLPKRAMADVMSGPDMFSIFVSYVDCGISAKFYPQEG